MQIAVIETFLKIAEVGSFSRASQLMFVTQPTVTARIQSLESNLGQKVFRRLNNTVELTQAGRAFLPHARTLVRTWGKARQEIALPQGFSGIVTVGAPPALWCDFLVDQTRDFQACVTNVAFNAVVADPKTLVEKLDAGEIDAIVVHEPSIKTDWVARKLFCDELILVSTTPRELMRWDPRYVYIDWGSGYQEQHYRAYPVDDTPIATFSDGQVALHYILATGGSAYLPRRWIERPEYAERLFPIADAPTFARDVFAVFDQGISRDAWRSDALERLFAPLSDIAT